MNLSRILNNIKAIQVAGNAASKEVIGITNNSKEVREGVIYVAVKGLKFDGHAFIPEAIFNKAAAVVLENNYSVPEELFNKSECVKILVTDSRKVLAQISGIICGNPSEKLHMIGITGTKGKTTTSYYIKNILETSGRKAGLIGTIANYIGKEKYETKLTTPESFQINSLLKEMVDKKCAYCVMEVSSHALALNRVDYIDFDSAVFTNITSDHFDFHKDFESYLEAKKKLFDEIKSSGNVIYNFDDLNSQSMIRATTAKTYSYGTSEKSDFIMSGISYDLDGTRFSISNDKNKWNFETKLIGLFNAYNAAAAISVSSVLGIDAADIIQGIASTPQVPGRFEVISRGEKRIIIDYSHTTDSLRQALLAIKHLTNDLRPVHTVFGCGGNRDKFKRPEMGRTAEALSTKIYITSDNPRDEEPMAIINDILEGVKGKSACVIESREEAIKKAILESESNAVILIAGKGHEDYQEINGIRQFFSDKQTAEKYLQ